MVNGLIFPTELNAAPDEIELIKTVRVDKPITGAIEYFVFKFRMHEPHWAAKDGWMVGVSGAVYRKKLSNNRFLWRNIQFIRKIRREGCRRIFEQ